MNVSLKYLLKTSFFILILTLFSKGVGFLREVIIAYYFGLNDEYDIFLVSITVISIINSTIYYLAQNFFIPLYNKLKEENKSDQFFNLSIVVFLFLSIFVTVLLLLFGNQILRLFVSTKNLNLLKLATEIFELYVLTIPFNALFSVIAAFLQARFKFIAVAVSYVVINLSTVLLLLIAKNNFGVLGVAFSILVGTFMQFVFLIPFTYKFIKIRTGWFKLIKENKSLISGALLITLFIELISLSYSFIDRYFYTELIKGGISAINYAQTITSIPTNFYATTLVTLIFSHFSLNSGQKNDVANFTAYNNVLKFNFLLFFPMFLIFYYFGDSIVYFLFERGKFDIRATFMTFDALKYLSIGIPFITAYAIMNKLMYSYGKLKMLLGFTLISFGVKLIFSFVLVKYFNFKGLALSTSAAYLVLFIICHQYISYIFKVENKFQIFKYIVYYLLMALIPIFMIYAFQISFFENKYFNTLIFMFLYVIIYFFINLFLDEGIKRPIISKIKGILKINV